MNRIMRKPDIRLCENKGEDLAASKLLSAPLQVFATRIINPSSTLIKKIQASSLLQCLNRPVCVAPGRKPRRPGFSRRGSNGT